MIEIKNLRKRYRKDTVIEDCSIDIKSNTVSFIMGPNGAGKTTLIKCLIGLEAYEGTIKYDGKDYSEVRDKCLCVWDDCPFYTSLSGIKNLNILSEGKHSTKEIKRFGEKYLSGDILKRPVKTYSYGQRKKLALALVEILNPEILIMDEVSNGLDFDTMMELQDSITQWAETKTVILTGHQFGFYNNITDDLYVIEDKKLEFKQSGVKDSNEKLEDIYVREVHKDRT